MRSGYKALNHFFNLRRTTFTTRELQHLDTQGQSVHYDFLLLWRMKCTLLKTDANYGGIVDNMHFNHIIMHLYYNFMYSKKN